MSKCEVGSSDRSLTLWVFENQMVGRREQVYLFRIDARIFSEMFRLWTVKKVLLRWIP